MNGWGRHEVLHLPPASRSQQLVCIRRRRKPQRQHHAAAAQDEAESTETETESGTEENELEWRPRPAIPQSPTCLRLMQELASGVRASFTAPMRSLFKDGVVWEMSATCWVGATEWTVEADGRSWERPTRIIVACGMDEAVAVEPL